MLDEVEPVPAVQLIVTWLLPAVADVPVGVDGGATGVTLYWLLHVVPPAFFAPTW